MSATDQVLADQSQKGAEDIAGLDQVWTGAEIAFLGRKARTSKKANFASIFEEFSISSGIYLLDHI